MTAQIKRPELNNKFTRILTTPKRYILITGGRGSSKSFSINTLLCYLTLEQGHRVLFTRYTMTSARISIIPEFQEKISLINADPHFRIKRTEIENKLTGSDIIFRGIKTSSGNQTANLKSIQGITTWVLEEAEELQDESVFDTIDLSIRTQTHQNRIILIMNPTTKDHWIYQRWFANHLTYTEIDGHQIPMTNHPDVEHIHMTYLDNKQHLSESYLRNIEKIRTSNPGKYIHKILGGWLEKAEGVIFENWTESEFPDHLPSCFGLDLGYFPDPLALVQVAIDKKNRKIFAREHIYANNLSTSRIKSKLKSCLTKPNDLIVSDTNEPRLIRELQDSGFNIQAAKKRKIIEDIREMQDWQILVDHESYNLKKELNHYAWNDKKASIPIDDHNHLIDGARYAFVRLAIRQNRGVRRRN